MPWQRWRFKGNKVYARVSAKDRLQITNGLAEIRYKRNDDRTYRVRAERVEPLPPEQGGDRVWEDPVAPPKQNDSPPSSTTAATSPARDSGEPPKDENGAPPPPRTPSPETNPTIPDNLLGNKPPIIVFTDGSCLGNPGPMGIGIVMTCAGHRLEVSEFLGEGTNNVAELTAVLRALELIKDPNRTVILYTDSRYVIGMIGGWKAKSNQQLIQKIQNACRRFPDLRIRKVTAHTGQAENERCDELAKTAVRNRTSSTWRTTLSGRPDSPGEESG